MYSVTGQTAATAATIDVAACQLWNGHSTQRVKIISFMYATATTNTNGNGLRPTRTSARGTVTSSVTPVITSHSRRGVAPGSGLTLDLDFSAEPTLDGNDQYPGVGFSGTSGGGDYWYYDFDGCGIWLPPGTGLALVNWSAVAVVQALITFNWLED
jgi:hypothetical protein